MTYSKAVNFLSKIVAVPIPEKFKMIIILDRMSKNFITSGLKITAGHRSMKGQIFNLTGEV